MNQHKAFILVALNDLREPRRLEKWRAEFRQCSPEEMDQEWKPGCGKTRAEILAHYEEQEAKIDRTIAWLMAQGE